MPRAGDYLRSIVSLLVLMAAGAPAAVMAQAPDAPADDPAGLDFFEKKIRPLLSARCYECHGEEKQKSGLRLDRVSAAITGGDSGPAIVPGDVDKSLLVQAVRYTGDFYDMPPGGKLPDEEIKLLTEWVRRGAPRPRDDAPAAAKASDFDLAARRAAHWSWQPLSSGRPPALRDTAWPRGDLDRYILARLEEKGLTPAPPAERLTWLRRVTFDLTGLPPTPEEIAAFLADDAREDMSALGAEERVVERLLDSPHFGERWARHWLDLVRYAETRGHEFDFPIPNAWQYRDYLIRAFNADVPYDRFVAEHIAGDLLPSPRVDPKTGAQESVLGTGFWFLGEEVHSPVDIRQDLLERVDNKLDVFSKTFLGITLACARCHDHKFDAISARDYYALAGFIESAGYRQVRFDTHAEEQAVALARIALAREFTPQVLDRFRAATAPALARLPTILVAARPVLLAGEGDARKQALAAQAAAHQLDEGQLLKWVEHLAAAAAAPQDPWHDLAAMALDPRGDSPERLAQRAMERGWNNDGAYPGAASENASDGAALPKSAKLLWNAVQDAPRALLQNGFSFHRALPGQARLSDDPATPRLGFIDRASAQYDPAFNLLALAAGSEGDPGRVNWSQPGRTFKTSSFKLASGRVFYLVRGAGYAYASVGLHRMIAGPLHGQLAREWPAADGWTWVEHDLRAYQGHVVHLEFSPKEGAIYFAVAMVIDADEPPAPPMPSGPAAGRALFALWSEPNRVSFQKLAAAHAQRLSAAVDRVSRARDGSARPEADQQAAAEPSTDDALLADWVAGHVDLFAPTSVDTDAATAAAALTRLLADYAQERYAAAEKLPRESRIAPALLEGSGVDELVLLRGNHRTPGDVQPRRFLEAVDGDTLLPIAAGSGRLELVARMTDPQNPMLARVMVNRLWHHLFGRGLVASVDNHGVLGERPTHPVLLDALAADFMREGWSVKSMLRRITLSSTYRMSSRPDPAAEAIDPQNLLLHRANIRRLQGEAIRDALLAASGRLDPTLFGPSVAPFLTPFMEGRGRPGQSGPLDGAGRRSVYLGVRRNFLSPFFLAFDYPIPFNTIGRRTVSNVPAQALAMLNDPLVVEQARLLAARTLADSPATSADPTAARIDQLYRRLYGRDASDDERRAAAEFLHAQASSLGADRNDPRPWQDLCHVLVNVKEFIFLY